MVKILIGCTGSVAAVKLPALVQDILKEDAISRIRVCLTDNSKHFFNTTEIPENVDLYCDKDEWDAWSARGDPVLHIELAKWADIFLIAPLDANTLAKMANGICDNLVTCVARAWDASKPLIFCPAMNTQMYLHPLTIQQITLLKHWGYKEIPVVSKTLMCGDTGLGGMAEVGTIVDYLIGIVATL